MTNKSRFYTDPVPVPGRRKSHTKYPNFNIINTPVPISQGGTGGTTAIQADHNLGGLHISDLNTANGVGAYDNNGKIPASLLPAGLSFDSMIEGPLDVPASNVQNYQMTNYDSYTTYTIQPITGSVAIINGDIIQYTAPPSAGPGGFLLNGRPININIVAAVPTVLPPTINNPVNNATNLGPTITFNASAFATINGSDTHEGSDWQIATDVNFTNIIYSVTNDPVELENWSINPSNGILESTEYYIRARYKGVTIGYSNWSNVIHITTKNSFGPSTLLHSISNGTSISRFDINNLGDKFVLSDIYTFDIYSKILNIYNLNRIRSESEYGKTFYETTISGNGLYSAIWNNATNEIQIYEEVSGVVSLLDTLSDLYNDSYINLSLSNDGSVLSVLTLTGLFIYERSLGNYTLVFSDIGYVNTSTYGNKVYISRDGLLCIASNNNGTVGIFRKSLGTWSLDDIINLGVNIDWISLSNDNISLLLSNSTTCKLYFFNSVNWVLDHDFTSNVIDGVYFAFARGTKDLINIDNKLYKKTSGTWNLFYTNPNIYTGYYQRIPEAYLNDDGTTLFISGENKYIEIYE